MSGSADDLFRAFDIERGVISLVGAGGKKTTMYALAGHHPGRVLLTSTSHMYPYDASKIDRLIEWELAGAGFVLDDADRVCAIASRTDTPKRIGGLTPEQISQVLAQHPFELCVIKSDGARARWIKAPAPHEPIIPPFADLVIPVISIQTIGRPLDERIAHRPERIAELVGAAPGDTITALHLSRLIASDEGALKDVGSVRTVPLLNMVDETPWLELAREVARDVLAMTDRIQRIVCASMKSARIVAVEGE